MHETPSSGKETGGRSEIFGFGDQRGFAGYAGFNPFLKLVEPQKLQGNNLLEEVASKSSSPPISRCSKLANLSDSSDPVGLIVGNKRPFTFSRSTSAEPIMSATATAGADAQGPGPKRLKTNWDPDRPFHESLLFGKDGGARSTKQLKDARLEEVRTAPLFSADTLRATADASVTTVPAGTLPQYGLLAGVQDICGRDSALPDANDSAQAGKVDNRVFLNTNTPWSAFVCGSQGSGKSHTLSCMLEAALLQSQIPNRLGKLPRPLAGIVFHYDKFAGLSKKQECEAAYLCSTGIPVKVLVSPASHGKMQRIYSNLEGVPSHLQPTVHPMLFEQQHLDVSRMLKLMAVDGTDSTRPLYMEVVCRVLRQIAMESQEEQGFNFGKFQHRLGLYNFNPGQNAMLDTRLDLLQDFMQPTNINLSKTSKKPDFRHTKDGKEKERIWENNEHQKRQAAMVRKGTWSFEPGSLTIVDLSCPFVDEKTACDLFQMCLAIFLEPRKDTIVALDEAHKFMNEANSASSSFTESLLSVIRQQRHLATRVIIATQEPTISPKLLDLSSMTIVHRFTSPSWFQALKTHLASVALSEDEEGRDTKEILNKILKLEIGEALLFSPSMILNITEGGTGEAKVPQTEKLGMGYLKMRVRNRLTADGGRSILAAKT